MLDTATREFPKGPRQPQEDNTFVVGDRVKLAPELDEGRKLAGVVLAVGQGRLGRRVTVRWDNFPWQSQFYYPALRLAE